VLGTRVDLAYLAVSGTVYEKCDETPTCTCAPRETLARQERQDTAVPRVPINRGCKRLSVKGLVREGTDIARVVRVRPL
jgi:hypothetical protein